MFRDGLYFMRASELNAWNRVHGAGGCRFPDQTDQNRVDELMYRVRDISILRTEAGHIPVMPQE